MASDKIKKITIQNILRRTYQIYHQASMLYMKKKRNQSTKKSIHIRNYKVRLLDIYYHNYL